MSDHRNILYFRPGLLTQPIVVLGKRQPGGVQIKPGPNDLKIEGK